MSELICNEDAISVFLHHLLKSWSGVSAFVVASFVFVLILC